MESIDSTREGILYISHLALGARVVLEDLADLWHQPLLNESNLSTR
jgi:hypothetical protein